MDPLADRAVAATFESGAIDRVNRLMTDMVGDGSAPPADLPPAIVEYLEATSALPDWADPDQIRLGEELFGAWGTCSCTILACASLPECYVMKNGIHVLATTQRLERHARRRVLETAQMIMAVMLKGGLAPGGPGVRTAQKVRLMHAAIRFLIQHEEVAAAQPVARTLADVLRREAWRPEYGAPINQEDLAFTLMTFSHVALRSLERLGAELTDPQKNAYVHCWNVVGHVMGIERALLPDTHQDARDLFERIKARQAGATPEAREMERVLIAFLEGLMPIGRFRDLPVAVTRLLVGNETADALGVRHLSWWDRTALATVLRVWRLIDRRVATEYADHSVFRFVSVWLHDQLMIEIGRIPAGWNQQLFNIPSSLVARLPPDWKHDPISAPSTFTRGLLSRL
jgi:hypothetical protein